MKLTPLDLGIGRFLEFSFTLVYHEVYAEEDLQAAARALLAKYPLLGSRVNFLVHHSLPYLYPGPCPAA
jgi:hypothetical protein